MATLSSKLDHGEGTQWSLRVKLNDGSAVVDCDLADEVHTSIYMRFVIVSLKAILNLSLCEHYFVNP